ncbi:MAG: hypothetical protein K2M70_05030 [Lachnospiraceae bacterium]|nr:hypothetical protein [Lachnospiraceae bacterium]
MVSVILIWIYILITTFIIGYGVLRLITRHFPYQVKNGDAYVLCGIVCVTVYAQFFSLFAGVGILANGVLCAVCAGILWRERKSLKALFSACLGKSVCGRILLIVGIFLLFAYGTSRGMIHYDTGLYHAQSIRWIEEYGVVKGLGNLHCRLAYNSAAFALSALYSMAFLGGGSFHCCAGFLAFLLAGICLKTGYSLRLGRLRTSDFARVMCVYYLVNIFDEMVSPASDYFMVLIAFYIVIRWLELLESGEQTILPYALLCVLGVFLLTVKLSAALILLLVIYPAYRLLREKKWRETFVYLGLGIVTALPYLIRNVVISGWLVYPFTQIDLFSAAWKIPKGVADYDAREIQVWGRGYTDVSRFEMPVREWLPGWFRGLAGIDRLFVAAAAVSVFLLFLYAAGMLFRWWRRRWELLLVQGTVAASFLFWLCTSPLMRYGCVYVYLTFAVVFGGIYETVTSCEDGRSDETERGRSLWQTMIKRAALVLTILLLLYKGLALGREILASYENAYWLVQKDYENYETLAYEIEGVTFYYPVQGDQVGYDSFPASPAKAEISLLGEGLADGFIVKEPEL